MDGQTDDQRETITPRYYRMMQIRPTRLRVRPAKTDLPARTAQTDQSLCCPPGDPLGPWLPTRCPAKTLIRKHGCAV